MQKHSPPNDIQYTKTNRQQIGGGGDLQPGHQQIDHGSDHQPIATYQLIVPTEMFAVYYCV